MSLMIYTETSENTVNRLVKSNPVGM